MKHLPALASLSLAVLALLPERAAADVTAYISGPGVQTAETSGMMYSDGTGITFLTETFDGTGANAAPATLPAGSSFTSSTLNATLTAASTNTATPTIATGNYGGNGQGKYLSVVADTRNPASLQTVTLKLNSPVTYFGFDFYAGDVNNSFSLYNGATFIGTYVTQSLINTLNTSPLKDINGDTVAKSGYYGQSGTGNDSSEPFAYIDLLATNGTRFDTIVFGQKSGSAFETDNFSIFSNPTKTVQPAGTFINIGTLGVPEPSTWLCLALGLGALALGQRRYGLRQA